MPHARAMFKVVTGLVLLLLAGIHVPGVAGDDPVQAANDKVKKYTVWNFESDEPGKPSRVCPGEVGVWVVASDGGNHVLHQKARNEDAVFNVALAKETRFKDVDLSVRLKAVAGKLDRGGGLIWRAKDQNNYYICRYNPLEDNYRVYKVENGKRTQFADAKVPGDDRWHTLRATMSGTKITCYLDGKKRLEADDSTFPGPGMIGLWSKSDAQSYFDDLTVTVSE